MANRILNWLTSMHWSTSPHGMGCVYPECPKWSRCLAYGSCLDFAGEKPQAEGEYKP